MFYSSSLTCNGGSSEKGQNSNDNRVNFHFSSFSLFRQLFNSRLIQLNSSHLFFAFIRIKFLFCDPPNSSKQLCRNWSLPHKKLSRLKKSLSFFRLPINSQMIRKVFFRLKISREKEKIIGKSSLERFPPVENCNHKSLEIAMRTGKSSVMIELINEWRNQ